VVLDGASQAASTQRSGGWLADTLGAYIRDRLAEAPAVDLQDVLAEAIAATAHRHALAPGRSPSTTVSIARWDGTHLDVLVLGDSPVIAVTHDGCVLETRDNRLAEVGRSERRALRKAAGLGSDHPDVFQALLDAQRLHRNQPGGYWIAEAEPRAAAHAIRARWRLDDLNVVMVMTDGLANGVDRYGIPTTWQTAAELACQDPARLLQIVHDAEESDPSGDRWPRSKRHDDKTIAVVQFDQNTPARQGAGQT
jgi:hypothetical protein